MNSVVKVLNIIVSLGGIVATAVFGYNGYTIYKSMDIEKTTKVSIMQGIELNNEKLLTLKEQIAKGNNAQGIYNEIVDVNNITIESCSILHMPDEDVDGETFEEKEVTDVDMLADAVAGDRLKLKIKLLDDTSLVGLTSIGNVNSFRLENLSLEIEYRL